MTFSSRLDGDMELDPRTGHVTGTDGKFLVYGPPKHFGFEHVIWNESMADVIRDLPKYAAAYDAMVEALNTMRPVLDDLASYGPYVHKYVAEGGNHHNTGVIETMANKAGALLPGLTTALALAAEIEAGA